MSALLNREPTVFSAERKGMQFLKVVQSEKEDNAGVSHYSGKKRH